MAAPKKSFFKKDPSKPKKTKAPKEKKKTKAPKDPNAPKKNIFGMEKRESRAELKKEIAKLQQEIAFKDGELTQLKQWARSAPIRY